MIAYLDGQVIFREERSVILNANGVGYKVFVSNQDFPKLAVGERRQLHCYTYVRKDNLDLYGFSSKESLELFKMLLGVSGIGPKIALDTLSLGPSEEIKEAISKANVNYFSTVPRLGKKNSQKIIIELKSKIGGVEELDLKEDEKSKEVIEALKSLGFSKLEARESYRAVRGKSEDVSELIKAAIKYLGKNERRYKR